jgi:hypothetical protein
MIGCVGCFVLIGRGIGLLFVCLKVWQPLSLRFLLENFAHLPAIGLEELLAKKWRRR